MCSHIGSTAFIRICHDMSKSISEIVPWTKNIPQQNTVRPFPACAVHRSSSSSYTDGLADSRDARVLEKQIWRSWPFSSTGKMGRCAWVGLAHVVRSRLTSNNGVVRFFDLDTYFGVGDCVVVEPVLARTAVGRRIGSIRTLVGVQTICKPCRASRNANRVGMCRWAVIYSTG